MEPDFNKDNNHLDEKTIGLPDVGEKKMFFFDAEGKSCDKEHAVTFVATVSDKDGKVIHETRGTCSPKRNEIDDYLNGKK